MIDMSSMPTASRTARCSAGLVVEGGVAAPALRASPGACPSTSNHSGYSQPDWSREVGARGGQPVVDRRSDGRCAPSQGCHDREGRVAEQRAQLLHRRSRRNRRARLGDGWVRSDGEARDVHRRHARRDPLGDEAAEPRPRAGCPGCSVPAATKKLRSSGASPRAGRCPAVKLSGPQNIVRTPASRKRREASHRARRGTGRSGPSPASRLANATSLGTESSDQASAIGSNRPTRMPPPSSR